MTNDFFKKLAVYGASAALLFALPSCGGENQQGALEDNGVINEEPIAENDGLVEAERTDVANVDYYDGWDVDRNGVLNQEEFRQNWETNFEGEAYDEGLFTQWDADANAGLDENEFRTGVWAYNDKDKNASLNQEEFRGVSRTYYLNRWDLDNNNTIAENEFREGWNNYMGEREYDEKLFGEWDVNDDGLLDDNEFSTGIFSTWDADKSGVIEEAEYRTNYL